MPPPPAQRPRILPALIRSLSADALSIKPSCCFLLKSLSQQNLIQHPNRQTGGFWAKDGKTWWEVRREGHSVFCPSVKALSERSRGQIMQPVVLPALQRKGLCGKRSIPGDLIFGYFSSRKSNSPPAAIEPGQAKSVMAKKR
jgi:hypothetical protein